MGVDYLPVTRLCVHRGPQPLVCSGHHAETWTPCRPLEPLCTRYSYRRPPPPPPRITALHPSLLCLPFCLPFAPVSPLRPNFHTLPHPPTPLSSPRSYPTALPSRSIPTAVHTEAYCVCRETAEGTRERDGAKKQTELSVPAGHSHIFTAVNSTLFDHIA